MLEPKQKAKELVDRFQKQIFFHITDERSDINEAKGLALIAVDEMLNTDYYCGSLYWQEVKQEIEKL